MTRSLTRILLIPPSFFYVGSYGRNVIGMSYPDSINLLLTMVAIGFIWRLLPNYFADKIGPLNMLLPFAALSSVMMFAWIGVNRYVEL